MLHYCNINANSKGLLVRAILNDTLRTLIMGDEGVNAIWEYLKKVSGDLESAQSLIENNYSELREQVLKGFDYTDTKAADLLTYINGMNGGISGFAIDTNFVPNFPRSKAVTVLGAGAGTYKNLLDINGEPIVVTDEDALTIFYKGADSTYWQHKTVHARVVIDRVSKLALSEGVDHFEITGSNDDSEVITSIELHGATLQKAGLMLPDDKKIISRVSSLGAITGLITLDALQAFNPISDEEFTENGYTDQYSRYIVTTELSSGGNVSVGILECFSDSTLSVYTQKFTTHYVLNENGNFDDAESDLTKVFTYFRSFNIGKDCPHIWTPWKKVQDYELLEAFENERKERIEHDNLLWEGIKNEADIRTTEDAKINKRIESIQGDIEILDKIKEVVEEWPTEKVEHIIQFGDTPSVVAVGDTIKWPKETVEWNPKIEKYNEEDTIVYEKHLECANGDEVDWDEQTSWSTSELGKNIFCLTYGYPVGEYTIESNLGSKKTIIVPPVNSSTIKKEVQVTYPWYINNTPQTKLIPIGATETTTVTLSGSPKIKIPFANSQIDVKAEVMAGQYMPVSAWKTGEEIINGVTYKTYYKEDSYSTSVSHKITITIKR